jgi:hypothetical protein
VAGGALTGRFPALKHRNFRRYALGQVISLAGFWMQSVAQGWLVYRLSGRSSRSAPSRSSATCRSSSSRRSPGVVADRMDKRKLNLVTQTLMMLLAAAQGLVVVTDLVTVPIVAGMAFCMGMLGAFDLPTRQSFMVELVGGDDLPAAIAFNASVFNTARVVGPAVAGVVVANAGEGPVLLPERCQLRRRDLGDRRHALRRAAPGRRRGRQATGLRSGFGYIRRRPVLAMLLGTLGVVSALSLQSNVIMPVAGAPCVRTGRAGVRGLPHRVRRPGRGRDALRAASRQVLEAEYRRGTCPRAGVEWRRAHSSVA